jgi:hypothetical protein
MENLLLQVIREYVSDVKYFIALLNSKSEAEKGFHIDTRKGVLNSKDTFYSFHGAIGIALRNDNVELNFDFSSDESDFARCDGFTVYWLNQYIVNNEKLKMKYAELSDISIVELLLETLLNKKVLEKRKDFFGSTPYVYFLKEITPVYFFTYPSPNEIKLF